MFGYHEVFHAYVCAAAACQYLGEGSRGNGTSNAGTSGRGSRRQARGTPLTEGAIVSPTCCRPGVAREGFVMPIQAMNRAIARRRPRPFRPSRAMSTPRTKTACREVNSEPNGSGEPLPKTFDLSSFMTQVFAAMVTSRSGGSGVPGDSELNAVPLARRAGGSGGLVLVQLARLAAATRRAGTSPMAGGG